MSFIMETRLKILKFFIKLLFKLFYFQATFFIEFSVIVFMFNLNSHV